MPDSLHMPWLTSAFLTDDLPPQQEAVCQQVASLSHHQLAGLWQASILNCRFVLMRRGFGLHSEPAELCHISPACACQALSRFK